MRKKNETFTITATISASGPSGFPAANVRIKGKLVKGEPVIKATMRLKMYKNDYRHFFYNITPEQVSAAIEGLEIIKENLEYMEQVVTGKKKQGEGEGRMILFSKRQVQVS